MAVKEYVLSTEYIEAIKTPCKRYANVKRVCSKVRALLEDYAIAKGHSFSKLLVIHICDLRGEIRRELEHHVQEVYPLSDDSKPSYISNIKRIIAAIINQQNLGSSKISNVLLDREIPNTWSPYFPC